MPAAVAVPLITAAVASTATVAGSKMASNSAKRASSVTAKADTDTLALERERDAEARRQWEADQQQKSKEFAASEEERAFSRQQAEIAQQDRAYQQQLLREREQRAAPYRQMSQQALGNLGQLLGIDMSGGGPLRAAGGSTGPSAPTVPQPMSPQMGRPQNVAGPMQAPTLGDLIAQQQRGPNAYPR